MRPKKKIYDFYSKEHKDFIERIFNAVNDNIIDSEVVDDEGYIDQFEAHHGCDFYMYNNYYPLTALSKGSYQFGDTERKAVDEFVDRCYKDAEEEGVDLEENDHENEFDWFKDKFDYESQYGWYVRFYLDFGEYPDYPEDGYVLYAEFIDGNGNKHISDNNAFITMNDDEDTIEKKVSRFMDILKFSDTNKLKESKRVVKESESDEEYRKRTFKTNMENIESFIQKADSRNDKVIESLASAIRVSRYYSEDKYDEEFKDLLERLRKIYEIFKGNGEELYDLVGDISYYIQNNITEN